MSAEHAVIGAMLLNNESFWKVADKLTAEDFAEPMHRRLFGLIGDQMRQGEPADPVTLGNVGGPQVMSAAIDLAATTPSAANVIAYAEIVQKDAEKRRMRKAGQLITTCDTYTEAQALLAAVRPMQSARIKTATDALREMNDALQVRFDAESVVTGTPTGLESLDQITGGWQEGDLIALGGDTSMGKTAAALQFAIAAGRCYYASLEMMASQLFERVVSNVGHVPYRAIRFPQEASEAELAALNVGAKVASKLGLVVDDQPGLSVDQIASRARQLHMLEPLKLIVVDHLNLIRRPRKFSASELGEIAIALKNLAKELRVPVLVLVQLNRGGKSGDSKRPEMGAFRDSGEIEEALDTAVMIYRDEYYNPNGPLAGKRNERGEWEPGYTEFIIRKQRQGERNVTAWAKTHLSMMRFESCADPKLSDSGSGGNDKGGGFQARPTQSRNAGTVSRVHSNHG